MDKSEELTLSYLLFFGVIGMLILAGAIVLFIVVYQRRLLNQQAQISKMNADYQEKTLELNIDAQEKERKRIANDLHDSIGSILSATRLYLNKIETTEKNGQTHYIKGKSIELLDSAITNIQAITRDLLPPSLDRFGLELAVTDLCKTVRDLNVLQVKFTSNLNQRIEDKQELLLYRIIQELINNTLKHAEAANILIQFIYQNNRLKLIYSDDGKGFNPIMTEYGEDRIITEGFGLQSIRTRVNLLDADIKYDTRGSLKKGMQVLIELDVKNVN